jgi:hypothetical protein
MRSKRLDNPRYSFFAFCVVDNQLLHFWDLSGAAAPLNFCFCMFFFRPAGQKEKPQNRK